MGKENPCYEYSMKNGDDRKPLEVSSQERDLGVIFEDNLSFDSHIQRAVSKANQILGLIRRSFDYIDRDMFTQLYKAFVRPHLEYGNIVWHPVPIFEKTVNRNRKGTT